MSESVELLVGDAVRGEGEAMPGMASPVGVLRGQHLLEVQAAALASVSDAVMITGADGVIVWVNDAFTTMSGFEFDEAVGHTPRILKSGEHDASYYRRLWETILAGRSWRSEVVERHKDGGLYRVIQTITPICDESGEVCYFVAVHENVTELRSSQARLQALFDHALDGILLSDDAGGFVDANPALSALSGYPREQLQQMVMVDVVPEWFLESYAALWEALRAEGQVRSVVPLLHADGHVIEVEVQAVADVVPGIHLSVLRDVTEQRRLQEAERFQAQLLDAIGEAVIATDAEGAILYANPAAERIYGWSRTDVLGSSVAELTVPSDHAADADDILERGRDGATFVGRFMVQRANGTRFPARVTTSPYRDGDGQVAGFIGVSVDITEQIAMQEQLARSNRELKAITNSIGEGLCVLDTEGRITYINPRGQRLLDVYVTEALGVRFDDWLGDGTKLRSDELVGIDPEHPVETTVRRRDGSEVPVEYVATPMIGAHDLQATGWILAFRDITERREREAKIAQKVEQALWLGRIRQALDTDGFVLHAQPIVDLDTGEVIQHELLIRMRDLEEPDSLIPPGMFLPVAEELGLAPAIDRWVLLHGLRLAATGMPVQINLSATSLDDPTLPLLIEQLLEETGADPATVTFEITETAVLRSDVDAERFAVRVHELGCRVALDDFGTGYGGFTYLKQLPVDELKIDVEFVHDAVSSPASRHVIDAVVSLARAFGLRTVGEGVEDQATLDLLKAHQVDHAQGFFLGRPEPVDISHEPHPLRPREERR